MEYHETTDRKPKRPGFRKMTTTKLCVKRTRYEQNKAALRGEIAKIEELIAEVDRHIGMVDACIAKRRKVVA